MTVIESPFAAVDDRIALDARVDPDRPTVWMWGEHDHATVARLRALLDFTLDLWPQADVTMDLRDVEFMDAGTIGTFAAASSRLAASNRRLVLRTPSLVASHLLDLCGMPGGFPVGPGRDW